MEEEKVDDINDEDIHYDIEDSDLRRKSREKFGIGVERLQPSTERNSYKSMSKQLQFLTNNDTCMNK